MGLDRIAIDVGRLPRPVAGPAHVLITHDGYDRFSATFQYGAQQGEIDGRADEVWTHAAANLFTFVGVDEGDELSGAAADVAFNAEDNTITGTMRYHQGDDLPFGWRRVKARKKATKAGVGKKKA